MSKSEARADDKEMLSEMTVFGRVKNVVRKGQNAAYQHFLLVPNVFKTFLLQVR